MRFGEDAPLTFCLGVACVFLFLWFILLVSGCSREIVKGSRLEVAQGVIQGASRETRSVATDEWRAADSVIRYEYVHDTLRVVQKVYKPATIINTRDTMHLMDTLYKEEKLFVRDTIYKKEEPTGSSWFLNTFWWVFIIGAGALAYWLRGALH